jgi:acyl phosphate:glycerol-3-phosphate acyltransferase
LWGVDVLTCGQRTHGRHERVSLGRSAAGAVDRARLDVAKGALAVLAGGAVIVGHTYSVFLRFRGGAGVGTSLGALGAISLPLAAGLVVLLLVVIVLTRYASVGSLTVSTLMPILLLALGLAGSLPLVYVLYGVLAWGLVVHAHRGNIRRLLEGSERRLGGRQVDG